MGTPTNRTPVRVARGTYSNLNTNKADIQGSEIVYATDENKLYVKEGTDLIDANSVDISGKANKAGDTFTGPITVGANTDGHDVKFFGNTTGEYLLWDENSGRLDIEGDLQVSTLATFKNQASFEGQVNFIQASGDQNITTSGNDLVFGQTVGNSGFQPHLKLNYDKFEAYYEGDMKLETTTDGAKVTGSLEVTNNIHLGSTDKIYFGDGAGNDWNPGSYEIYENNDLYIKSNGGHMRHQLAVSGTGVLLEGPTGSLAKFIEGGACELYHDDKKKLETTADGVTITGNLIVNGTTTEINTQQLNVDDKNIELGSVSGLTGIYANLISGENTVTLYQTGATTTGFLPGAALTQTQGPGNFGSGAYIGSVTSSTEFTVVDSSGTDLDHTDTGNIEFEVGGPTDHTADGGGITLKGTTDKTILWSDTSDSWEFNQPIKDPLGDVRKIPQNLLVDVNYTLLDTDSGKHVVLQPSVDNSKTLTVDPNVFSAGDAVTILNHSTKILDIDVGTGMNLYNSADGTTPTALAGRGMVTLLFLDDHHCYISGAGLS